jgi:DNA-binding beta-propeller fold protein YncE
LWLVVDVPLHSVYVVYQDDDALAVVDTNVCKASDRAACATLHPPEARTGAEPESVVLDQQTQTLYTANEVDNDVSVIDASRCNAQVTSGCRQAPTTLPVPAASVFTVAGLAADAAVNTLYTITAGVVSMVNTSNCNRSAQAGCASTPPQVTAGTYPAAIAVDARTGTVYVANFGSRAVPGPGTVSVIDAATCNATDQAGCADLGTLEVPGGNAEDIAIDAATDTIYVVTETDTGPNLLSVFNGATCNASIASGCNQVPATLEVGDSGGEMGNSQVNIAVNDATNTIYATNVAGTITGNYVDNGVYVINGAVCDAADTAGCGQTPPIITGGLGSSTPSGPYTIPWGIAVDEATDTIYVSLEAGGDYAGSVLVINGAICNGSDVAGCNQVPPTVAAGFDSTGVAIDPRTHTVYTTNQNDSSLSVIDGATCNRFVSFGCGRVPPKLPTGSFPTSIAIDPAVGTAYVGSLEFGISVVPLVP